MMAAERPVLPRKNTDENDADQHKQFQVMQGIMNH